MFIKKFILIVLILVLISGWSFSKDKPYYNQFKNKNLDYSWDFNSSLGNKAGHTYNSTYFQIKKYPFYKELLMLKIPYEITYKHEEGHIFQSKLLKIENFDDFESKKAAELNVSDYSSWRQYVISVSEGISDYYAINYFNNRWSNKYWKFIEKRKQDYIKGYQQHYLGFKYVNYTLDNNSISLENLTFNLCSKKQYEDYLDYISHIV